MPWRIVDLTIEGNSFIARLTDGRNEIELSSDLLFLCTKTAILKGCTSRGWEPIRLVCLCWCPWHVG